MLNTCTATTTSVSEVQRERRIISSEFNTLNEWDLFASIADQNITYTCSKVTIVGEAPATSGCFSEKLDGYEVEVCACRSRIGDKPCNSAGRISVCGWLVNALIVLLLAIRINQNFN